MLIVFHFFVAVDPFETQNRESSLTAEEKAVLHETLEEMKRCRGKGCTLPRHQQNVLPESNMLPSGAGAAVGGSIGNGNSVGGRHAGGSIGYGIGAGGNRRKYHTHRDHLQSGG